jgi:alcohol dehydrogenase YqhD (iron-dependent ADH family)
MSNIYYAPTKLLIDYDIHNIGNLIEEYGYKRVLVVYGKGSIKKQGLYDIVINSLKEKNLIFFEEGGVEANPKVEFVRNVLNLSNNAKNYQQ